MPYQYNKKIYDSAEDLLPEIKALKNKKIVFANGCFDLFHKGHLDLLYWAKEQGDVLIAAVNRDETIKNIKNQSRPIFSLNDRMSILAGLECVDYVISFGENTPIEAIECLTPNVVVKGGDYLDVTNLPEYPIVKAYGGNVVLYPYMNGYSTTQYIKKCKECE